MARKGRRTVYAMLVFVLVLNIFSGCEKSSKEQPPVAVETLSFRDILGITQDEISAIEALRKKHAFFVYGMSPSTEAFVDNNGEIRGYAPLFCDWLTKMFGIPFRTEFYDWGDLLRELESGDVDFTGELMTTPERQNSYFMTSSIAERSLKIYRIRGSESLDAIIKSRPPRYAFLKGSVLSADVAENAEYTFETVFIGDYETAYRMLKSGEVDAYFGMDTSDAAFTVFGEVVSEDFYPLIFKSACLSARKPELAPIISAVEKALDKQTLDYLAGLYKEGHQQYLRDKLYNLLTEEERAYIQNNPVVPIAVEFDNYPLCFFDINTDQWHGIYFDTLDEITKLTGLTFERANDQNIKYQDLITMLENGEVLILPELFRLKQYEGRFLWSEIPLLVDNYAFLSKSDFQNIEISQIPYLKIASRRERYAEFFKSMFPNHRYLVEYDTQGEVWNALRQDEVDIIFGCNRKLITYTNFYEEAGYKLNLILNYSFDSSFGYNKDAVILKSIVDKALGIINVGNISNQWMHKSYDYRIKLSEAQRPWLIGASVLFFLVLILVSIFLIRSRGTGKRLEDLVKQRTSALAFQTSKLQAMIASIPDLMYTKDTNLRYTQCNKSYEEFIGFRENDILGKTNEEGTWFTPEDAEKFHSTDEIVINENRILSLEQKVRSPVTGEKCVHEIVKAPLRQDGAVVGIIAIIRDITRRKEMEKELALQTSMLKTMITSLPDAVFCKDLEFKYTLCNDYMANGVFGKKVEDILGKDDEAALGLHSETAALARDSDLKVMNEKQRIAYEEWIHCANGDTRLFETVKSPLILDGEVTGIMGIGRDITRRYETEKNLAFETSKLKAMIDSIPDYMFCKDINFRYTQCNKIFEQFIGVSEADLLGKADKDSTWFSPEQAEIINSTERSVIYEDRIVSLEETVCSPVTGKESVFETVKAPIRQDGVVVGIIAIIRDITRRKEMEEEVMSASRAKSAFLANMSHELRTPLNVVIGLTDLILEDDRLDKRVSNNLVKISNAGSTLLSIVNDILDFSKIESGKLTLAPIEYYVSSLLNDIITLVVTRLGEKPIKFHLNINDDLPNKLYGDDVRVKQVYTNLLTNAVKYTREGSIELSVRCERESDTVWMDVAVTDTGMGIPKDDQKNLFLDYYQVATNFNRNIEGTGLGLPITKRLVEMMEGTISVESEQGKGSTFSFRIKQGFVSDTPLGADVSDKLRNFCYSDDKRVVTRKLVRVNLSYARVLVVDDMETNLDVATGILGNYKMQVDCLTNGPAAIERIRGGTPVYNAIFMDHMMPGMDGIEAADRIRALGTEYARKIPIIALTANAIQGTDKMFYAHDFQAFITKPIDVVEMDTILRKWVRDDTHADVPVIDESSAADIQTENTVIEIPGVNTKKGLSLYAGEKKIYLPLLRSYAANTPGILDKLRTVSAETLPDYVITVHGLKGTSAGIGAEAIREAALNLETMSRAGDLQGVLAKNDKLIADTEIIVANVKAWLQQYDAKSEKKPRLKAPDRELLARLRQSCENYDMDGIDKVMAELEKADYDEDADLIPWLREKVETSEFDEAAERLKKY